MTKSRELAKAYRELIKFGAVEVNTANKAVQLKRYAEGKGIAVKLVGQPGKWRVYDISRPMGFVS